MNNINNNMMNNNIMNNNMANNNMMNMMNNNNINNFMMMNMIMNANQMMANIYQKLNQNNNNNNDINNINNNANTNTNSKVIENIDNIEKDKISIFFHRQNRKNKQNNFKITILCLEDELISEVVKRYCHKTQENQNQLLFLFNSKKLELNKTVREATLAEGSIILVVDVGPMTGGF